MKKTLKIIFIIICVVLIFLLISCITHFEYWLRLSMGQLQKYGYDAVMDEDKIDVYSVE